MQCVVVSVNARLNVNVALKRPSWQVSTWNDVGIGIYYPQYANDGGHGTNLAAARTLYAHPAGDEPVVGRRPDCGTVRRRRPVHQQRQLAYVYDLFHEHLIRIMFCNFSRAAKN